MLRLHPIIRPLCCIHPCCMFSAAKIRISFHSKKLLAVNKLNARFCVELKRCPSFQKTLPMALENITDENLKRCP